MVKKFESLMGKFIWQGSGKILRVAFGELKNQHLAGGLNMPCLTTMSEALHTSLKTGHVLDKNDNHHF